MNIGERVEIKGKRKRKIGKGRVTDIIERKHERAEYLHKHKGASERARERERDRKIDR